jgi:hypothetical protein
MQAKTRNETESSPKIEFIQFHRPRLEDGDYEITVTQEIETTESASQTIPKSTFTRTQKFSVLGDRFSLNPQDIHAVFPPAGSQGEHSNVLPHIILNRSTLPWERLADTSKKNLSPNENLPWLALLLFDEDEKPTPKIFTLWDLTNISNNTNNCPAKFPQFDLETGQHDDDKVTVIDVKKEQLEAIMPTAQDLAYLAHVRQGTDASDKLVGDELAVIICNRLPKKDGSSTVHLVSLEGRYKNEGFDYQNAGNEEFIRLVSLTTWSFACVDEKQSFKGLLTHLNDKQAFSTLRLPQANNENHQLHDSSHSAEAENYLKMGYVPLPHYLRKGAKTISWYHSPLAPGGKWD